MAVRADFSGFEPYELTDVHVTGRMLGHGAYASVLELEYMGLKCAGKKVHEILYIHEGYDNSYSVRRFEQECRLLSQVHHSNIVQFLGVYFEKEAPVPILVMELLPTNLTYFIKQFGVVHRISYSILYDVALGLQFLHSQSPPIIHRDLTSNSVLLTNNMTAKICDLGLARIIDDTHDIHLSGCPGVSCYMPPEAMVANPVYDVCIDEFSYGILMIHIFSGQWPEPKCAISVGEDGMLIAFTEAERRKEFLQAIGDDHPLMDLILKCIRNDPKRRAHAGEILERLMVMIPDSFAKQRELITLMQKTAIQALKSDANFADVQNNQSKIRHELCEIYSEEIDQLCLHIEELKLEAATLQQHAVHCSATIASEATSILKACMRWERGCMWVATASFLSNSMHAQS